MKISEALQTINGAPAEAPEFKVLLACGFTPLHLQTFLAAHLQRARPARRVVLRTGLFGDLAGTVRPAAVEQVHAVAVAMEWTDLDPRLGYRNLGGWGPREEADIAAQVRSSLTALEQALVRAAGLQPVAVSLPALPLPPAFHPAAAQAGRTQAAIAGAIYEFSSRIAANENIRLVSDQQLAFDSPPAARFDLKSHLITGFPYSLDHASRLGAALAQVIAPPVPKKGLITDLDDTLWKGIAGDAGPDKVFWDLSSHAQLHGLYQQTLSALADQGVLLAVASKNDPAVVEQAFARRDIVLSSDKLFPMEVHWNAKSGSVARILKAWNIGADAVVFVDDSPMELAEVQEAFPAIECLPFPKDDYRAFDGFLRRLRDVFGKPQLSAEDAGRLESIRQASTLNDELASAGTADAFLSNLGAAIAIETNAAADPRCLELINKTNQFNLNGRRYEKGEWQGAMREPGSFVWAVSYRDKFGPLGTIAVIHGRGQTGESGTVVVDAWVMSCRAFARRIEYQSLKSLFDRTGANEIVLDFQPTPRNGPCAEFLTEFAGEDSGAPIRLNRAGFLDRCPALFHNVTFT